MKRIITMAGLLICVMMVSGCYTTGMSNRETGQFQYSNFVYGLYAGQESAETRTPVEFKKPIQLAVAQIGEACPPESFLDDLKAQRHIIKKVIAIPASGPDNENGHYNRSNNQASDSEAVRIQMERMCRLARDLDAEYLYIFGGSVDYTKESNLLSVLDLTIIGGFIFPSVDHYAQGRISGALIDLKARRIVLTTEASDTLEKSTPSYFQTYDNGSGDLVIAQLRKKLIAAVAEDLSEKIAAL